MLDVVKLQHNAACASLHLIEHIGERRLELESLLDFVGAHIRILAVFEEARALVFTNELDERWRIRLPIRRKVLEVFEDRSEAEIREEAHRVLCVFVEVGVEDALIHEVGLPFYREENPAQVMQFEYRETVGRSCHRLLDVFGVLVEHVFSSGNDLRYDRKAVARRSFREDGAVSALLNLVLEVSTFGDRHYRRLGPVVLLCWI